MIPLEETMRGAPTQAIEAVRAGVATAAASAEQGILRELGSLVGPQSAKLAGLVHRAKDLKLKALVATDIESSRKYADAYATTIERIKTVALADAVVKSDQAAAMVQSIVASVLDVLGDAILAVIGSLAQAAVKGAVEGLVDNDQGSFRR